VGAILDDIEKKRYKKVVGWVPVKRLLAALLVKRSFVTLDVH